MKDGVQGVQSRHHALENYRPTTLENVMAVFREGKVDVSMLVIDR